jgi:hypothetical protein
MFLRLTLSRAYVSTSRLPVALQGSLPACGSSLWPGGIRTRWTDTPNFGMSPKTPFLQDLPFPVRSKPDLLNEAPVALDAELDHDVH